MPSQKPYRPNTLRLKDGTLCVCQMTHHPISLASAGTDVTLHLDGTHSRRSNGSSAKWRGCSVSCSMPSPQCPTKPSTLIENPKRMQHAVATVLRRRQRGLIAVSHVLVGGQVGAAVAVAVATAVAAAAEPPAAGGRRAGSWCAPGRCCHRSRTACSPWSRTAAPPPDGPGQGPCKRHDTLSMVLRMRHNAPPDGPGQGPEIGTKSITTSAAGI